jgi:hypothetical protein
MRRGEIVLLFLLSASGSAQTTVSGTVHDSLARAPLAGATVQIVATDSTLRFARATLSDSLGRYTIADVPDGTYKLGFFHPMLDSLGLDPIIREVRVGRVRSETADLAIPAPQRVRDAICGSQGGVIVGVIRDARTSEPVFGATVTAEWFELDISKNSIGTRRSGIAEKTRDNGWFALCYVPSPGTMTLQAARGADSTDVVEVSMPDAGFLRGDLYIGSGSGLRMRGAIVSMDGTRPVPEAQVSLTGAQAERTNERGEWATENATPGTRMIEVRAVGYFPERRAVNVVEGAPALRVSLFTMRAMLDTIRVTATRLSPNMKGFEERRRSGMGRYVDAEFIARRRPNRVSDVLRFVPGLYVYQQSLNTSLQMRGNFGERCVPAVYVDGHFMRSFTGDDLDSFVNPDDIAGIEVYHEPTVPPQFSMGLAGDACGSIVVWTRPPIGPRIRRSWKQRLVIGGLLIGAGFAIGQVLFGL